MNPQRSLPGSRHADVLPYARIMQRAAHLPRQAVEMGYTVTGPKVDDAEFQRRWDICMACEKRREHEGKFYCGACGCPKWGPAELTRKLRWQRLRCPLKKFGGRVDEHDMPQRLREQEKAEKTGPLKK